MKPKAIGGVLGFVLLAGAVYYFYKMETAVQAPQAVAQIAPQAAQPVRVAPPAAAPAPTPPPTPVPFVAAPAALPTTSTMAASLGSAPPPSYNPFDSGLQTSITIITLWSDSQAPAAGTSVTLRGVIGGKAVDGWRKAALTDRQGVVRMAYPEVFDWLVVTSLQPMAARVNTAYERRTGDRVTTLDSLAPLTDPLIVKLTRGGRVFGTVRRADNSMPVAGAIVIGSPQGAGSQVTARSGADGQYSVDYLPAGMVTLEARGDGLYFDGRNSPPVTIAAGEVSGPYDLALAPGASIAGIVTDRLNGYPLPGATVVLSGDERTRPTAVSGPDGRYEIKGIPSGSRQMAMATYSGYAPESASVTVGASGATQLDFQLGPGGRLEATVRDEKRNPVEGATVQVPRTLGGSGGVDASVKTDAQGHATLENVSRGAATPTILVSKSGYQSVSLRQRPEFDAQGVAHVDFTLTKTKHSLLTFFGLISDASGNPLPGIEVAAGTYFGNSPSAPKTTKASSGADGAYRLGPVDVASDSTFMLMASGKGWGSNVKQPPAPDNPEAPVQVDFTMEAGHWVGGIVVNEQKAPIAGVRVSLNGSGIFYQLSQAQSQATTKEDGKFRFEDLPVARFSLQTTPAGARLPVIQDATPDQEMEIVIKSGGIVRGRVVDALTKLPIPKFSIGVRGERISSGEASAGQPFENPEGRFVLENVDRNQPNRLTVRSAGYAALLREHVEAGDPQAPASAPELALELTPAKPLLISLVDKASRAPVAGASLIVGVMPANSYMDWDYLVRQAGASMTDAQLLTSDANGMAAASEGNEPATILVHAAGYANTTVRPADRPQFAAVEGRLVISLARGGSISGIALVDGVPSANQSAHLSASGPMSGGAMINMNAQIDGAGNYKFTGLSAGAYSISVTKRFGNMGIIALTRRAQLAEGQELTLNIGDDPGPTALFGVVTQAGKPMAARQITLNPSFDWEYTGFGTMTDANGEYRILGLRPGSYRFTLQRSQMEMDGRIYTPPVSETVVVGPEPTQRDFDVAVPKNVSIHLVFPPEFPPTIRSAMRTAVLAIPSGLFGGIFNQPTAPQIDRSAQVPMSSSDRIVFSGRMQGGYRLSLKYLVPRDPIGAGPITAGSIDIDRVLSIDNLQADVDLGDVLVPLPPAAR